jgi:ComF family protein
MAEAVNILYSDIKFDYICAVPASKSIFLNSNYDHCNYLCKELSKFLKIPYTNKILYCKGHKKQQHKLSIKNRLTNVNGKFYFNYRIDGATVLLVDDIRTTGATLDECAKMLLYAGADKVYCVTALATVMDLKKKIEN